MPTLTFSVAMTPQPQGSARAFVVGKRAIVTTDNTRLRDYRQAVAWSAQAARPVGWTPIVGPADVSIAFTILRPKSTPRRRTFPTTRPDLDKLVRAVLDALTGIAFVDDAQVVTIAAEKRYGAENLTTVTVGGDV